MPLTIPVAHDFICPWCWVGLRQARQLQAEFDVEFEWLGYELMPEALEWGSSTPSEVPANRPETLSRFQFLLVADGLELPKSVRPRRMRTHNAHEAVEYAKGEGSQDALIDALYHAYWEDGEEINNPDVLRKLADGIVTDLDGMSAAIESRRFADRIVGFDDDAYANGIYNVPTFIVGEGRYAEQPYVVLRKAVKAAVEAGGVTDHYGALKFPEAPSDRPYLVINMVTTIDGKSVSGDRGDSVVDLGSKVDHLLMKRIEAAADGIMLGAQTLRATSPNWDPKSPKRIVVSRSGDLPQEARFFTGGESFIATSTPAQVKPFGTTRVLPVGEDEIDFRALLGILRDGLGVQRLLVSGGSELNAQLLALDLVDELFLTIAAKVKLGRDVPTYAGGDPLPQNALLNFDLVEHKVIGNEVFLRYRRRRG